MATRGSRNNVLAGVFVVACLALGLAVVIVLSDAKEWITPMTPYVVRFPLETGAPGLQKGSPVMVGGQVRGRVTGVTVHPELTARPTPPRLAPDSAAAISIPTPTGAPTRAPGPLGDPAAKPPSPGVVDVAIKIDRTITLYDNARVNLMLPLFGSASSLNLPRLGTADGHAAVEAGGILEGRVAPPPFLTAAGYGDEQAEDLQAIMRNARLISEHADEFLTGTRPKLDEFLDKGNAIATDVKGITSDVAGKWPTWSTRADSTLKSVDEGSGKLNAMTDDAKAVVDSIKGVIGENRERVAKIMENADSVVARVRAETMNEVHTLMDKGQQGVDYAKDVAARASKFVREKLPDLSDMVANGRLASDQLKLALTEIRQAPWKLLAKPEGRKELENEALYDAARQYAIAVGDLKSASAALEAVTADPAVRAGHADTLDREAITRMVDQLDRSFARYRQAEQVFLDRLVKK